MGNAQDIPEGDVDLQLHYQPQDLWENMKTP